MYALANARPLQDASQDWELVSSVVQPGETDPFIAFHAKRWIDTGDPSQDHLLMDDSRPHIDATPMGEEETMSFHGSNTGRGVVRFFGFR